MPQTLSVHAKEICVVTEFTATEIKKLHKAMMMCEGGPGRTEEEKEAWAYFVDEFFPYIHQEHDELARK